MPLGYTHGVYAYDVPTSVIPMRHVSSGIPVVFGTAPVHRALSGDKPVNTPVLAYSYAEAVKQLGHDKEDWDNWTLSDFVTAYYGLYKMAPAIFINVFDPAVHKGTVAAAEATFVDDIIQLPNVDLLPDTLVVTSPDDATTYVEDVDYEIDELTGKITRLTTGAIAADATIKRAYEYADPSLVDRDDIIGGVDAGTGEYTGLELIDKVFPMYRIIPGTVCAPGWSQDPVVAIVMAAKAVNINGHFRAMAVIDIDDTACPKYQDVPEYKNLNNLTDEYMVLCWPRVQLDKTHWMSSHLAGLMAQTDANHGDIPYVSPSNKRLEITRAVANGAEIWLGPEVANYLNGNGVVTALNFDGGWKCWGNRTAAYPAVTDVKDSFIPIRRMFNWLGNSLVLSFWSKVDFPVTRRLLETIQDSANLWFNGLSAREIILDGRVVFERDDNPITDVMDGVLRFHCYVTPPSPAREVDFLLEYDPEYLHGIFDEQLVNQGVDYVA